jgi:hypothetical protein
LLPFEKSSIVSASIYVSKKIKAEKRVNYFFLINFSNVDFPVLQQFSWHSRGKTLVSFFYIFVVFFVLFHYTWLQRSVENKDKKVMFSLIGRWWGLVQISWSAQPMMVERWRRGSNQLHQLRVSSGQAQATPSL